MREEIGSYRVTQLLGQGGMGIVYEAFHDTLKRRAAIKVLLASQDLRLAERFAREARALSQVDHPGVVQVFEVGQLESGERYLVMEYLEGETLRARLERSGALELQASLSIARQVARTLEATHGKGIVHRDLKPDNVMIVKDPAAPSGERTKLFDFGIAKVAPGGGEDPTQTGAFMGTPAYMAPEQCRGADRVDARADIYALGVMLFEMLSGRRPFESENRSELVLMQLSQEPPPLDALRAGLPPRLVRLVHLMMAKERDARPLCTQVIQVLESLGAAQTRALPQIIPSSGPMRSAAGRPLLPLRTRILGSLVILLVGALVAAILGLALSRC